MAITNTTAEWAGALGEQIRALRIDQGLEQAEVAERASVSRPAISDLENGAGSSLSTFIKVLTALGASEWLATLHPTETEPSPLELLRRSQRRAPRSRVRKGRA